MLGVKSHQVRLEAYQEIWQTYFNYEKYRLQKVLNDYDYTIKHVGSTAIVGALAKPIIDIAITIKNIDNFDIDLFTSLGYEFRGSAGIDNRYFFVLRSVDDLSLIHLHCYAVEDINFMNQCLFVDYLNQHADMVKAYNLLKQNLIKENLTRDIYTERKATFIQNVLNLIKL